MESDPLKRDHSSGEDIDSDSEDEIELSTDKVHDPEVIDRDPTGGLVPQSVTLRFEGPLPHPDILEKYNKIIPNGADRVMIMAESEQTHRHDMNNKAFSALSSENNRAQNFAFTLAISGLIGSFCLIGADKDILGASVIIVEFIAFAGAFIGVRRDRAKDQTQEEESED